MRGERNVNYFQKKKKKGHRDSRDDGRVIVVIQIRSSLAITVVV